ncbi:MAG: transporter substrate-binding domain-containing protein, partial [Pseudomonadota bacterium]
MLVISLLILSLLAGPALAAQTGPTGVAHSLGPNPQERQWLAAHPPIRVGWANSPPVAFAGADGRPQGIVMDYLEVARRELGLEFQVITYPNFKAMWDDLRAGRLDLAPAAVDSPERERLVIRTQPFLTIPLVVMTRGDGDHLHHLSELHGKTLIVTRDQLIQYWLERDYPQINLVAGDYESGLWAVAEGRVQGIVGGLVSLVWVTRELGIDNLKVAFATEYNYQLGLVVRRDLPVLAAMLDRVLAAVPEVEQNAIYRRWVPVQVDGMEWKSIWEAVGLAVVVVGLVLAFVLAWNRRLAREVARRRQAEAVLTSTKRLFETVFKSQMDAIFVLDASTPPLIMECNAAAERMFGYLRSEMLGRSTAFLHVDEQHLQRLRDGLFPAARAQGFYTSNDFEMIRQNGEIFPCDLSIAQLTGDDGRHLGWVSVISDAGLRKQAREERQRLFDLSLVMLCVTGVDGYFREVNPAWSAILGWSPEELKARTCLEFI